MGKGCSRPYALLKITHTRLGDEQSARPETNSSPITPLRFRGWAYLTWALTCREAITEPPKLEPACDPARWWWPPQAIQVRHDVDDA